MPELPEVTIFKQYIDATCLQQKINELVLKKDLLLKETSEEVFKNTLLGREFESTKRHGKYLFIKLTGSQIYVLFHFGMTGSFSYYNKSDNEPEYARIIIGFNNGYQLSYNSKRMLGEIRLIQDMNDYLKSHNIGPDALDESLTKSEFKRVLNHRKGVVKSVLMNQEVIAGIGNEYSDEILFQAHIHPKIKIQTLSDEEIDKVYEAMRSVLKNAINHRTNYDELKHSFLLANRGKKGKCPICHSKLDTIQVAGRTAYYCPTCQSMDLQHV